MQQTKQTFSFLLPLSLALLCSGIWSVVFKEFSIQTAVIMIFVEKIILFTALTWRIRHTKNPAFWKRVLAVTLCFTIAWATPYVTDYSFESLIVTVSLFNYGTIAGAGALISLRKPSNRQYFRSIAPLAIFIVSISMARFMIPRGALPPYIWDMSYLAYLVIIAVIMYEVLSNHRTYNMALLTICSVYSITLLSIFPRFNPITIMDDPGGFAITEVQLLISTSIYTATGFLCVAACLMKDAEDLGQSSRFLLPENDPSGWTVELSVIYIPLVILLAGELNETFTKLLGAAGIISGMIILSQISDLRKSIRETNEELEIRVTRDSLTSFNNRKGFMDIVNTLDRKYPMFLLFLDLDKFKPVNDTYGHAAGDFVLKVVAKRIDAEIPNDGVSCRWGGDEFLVVARYRKDLTPEQIRDRIQAAVAKPIAVRPEAMVQVGITIGISRIQADDSVLAAIRKADLEMYERKRGSKMRLSAEA